MSSEETACPDQPPESPFFHMRMKQENDAKTLASLSAGEEVFTGRHGNSALEKGTHFGRESAG